MQQEIQQLAIGLSKVAVAPIREQLQEQGS
jgi:hypothetical protein